MENSHVKSNLVHSLYRVSQVGQYPLEYFKDLLSAEDYLKCKNKKASKAWYPLTTDVFVRFICKVIILF